MKVSCDDCHVLPAGMAGPHGSAVSIWMDPAYSQTEYANPSRTLSQFFLGHAKLFAGFADALPNLLDFVPFLAACYVCHPSIYSQYCVRFGNTCVTSGNVLQSCKCSFRKKGVAIGFCSTSR